MRLIVYTQVRENYGVHDWDGSGEVPQNWKNKGGSEHVVAHLSYQEAADLGARGLRDLVTVKVATHRIERFERGFEEYVIDWELTEELTEFERLSLEYDGQIDYPAHDYTVGAKVVPIEAALKAGIV